MSTTGGFNQRTNIHGYTVVADPEIVKKMKRLSTATLVNFFRQARDQGSAPFQLDDTPLILIRRSDHTYTVIPRDERHHPVL